MRNVAPNHDHDSSKCCADTGKKKCCAEKCAVSYGSFVHKITGKHQNRSHPYSQAIKVIYL